ncbi:2Fe-2S iron-sulfur cluster-binding protein [Salmonella enterica]
MPIFRCDIDNAKISFSISDNETILQAACKSDTKMIYKCASGYCGFCKIKLIAGKVKMDHSGGISKKDIADGYILPCCSTPLTDISLVKR